MKSHKKTCQFFSSFEDPSMESARALLERIKKGDLSDGFTPRDVYHKRHWSKLNKADHVNDAIKLLEEFSWLKTETVKTSGRPSAKIFIHPQLKRGSKLPRAEFLWD